MSTDDLPVPLVVHYPLRGPDAHHDTPTSAAEEVAR